MSLGDFVGLIISGEIISEGLCLRDFGVRIWGGDYIWGDYVCGGIRGGGGLPSNWC